MDNLLTHKTPTGMVIAQAVGITTSVFLLGELPPSHLKNPNKA